MSMNKMTPQTLRAIIDGVESDPLAGMGSITKKEILIDRLLAHWNTVEQRPADAPKTPVALITEPSKPNMGGAIGAPTAKPAVVPNTSGSVSAPKAG